MSHLFCLTEAQMARLEPFFPKSHGKPHVDDRQVLSGIILINRNDLRWRDAPKEYGPPKTLYNRWNRWSDKGIFARLMAGLAAEPAVVGTGMPVVPVIGTATVVRRTGVARCTAAIAGSTRRTGSIAASCIRTVG